MKDFLKYTLATVVGLIITGVIMGILGVVTLVGMVAASQKTTVVKENSVFVLELSGSIEEQGRENVAGLLTGDERNIQGLNDMLEAISRAKTDDNIKGIYIDAGAFLCDSPASAKAIRDRLADFRKSGKWIVAYANDYTQTTYYICSVADKVFINPQGMLDWHGLSAQPWFYKDMLAKVGIKVQLSKVGKYKSAPEELTADGMSEPNRAQVTAYLNGIWDVMLTEVAASRKLKKDTLNGYADRFMAFASQNDYVALKLVDGLMYADQVRDELKKMLKIDKDKKVNQLTLSDMGNLPDTDSKGDEVAVYYAQGSIVSVNPGGLSAAPCIASEKVCRDLDRLADDDRVKAVVLRVNSGGGSAYASEQIWRSVTNLKAKKPVVVSMGGYAASGGYYISCAANYIYAEPTTITGSIGIFGMFPDFSGLLTDKLGIKFDEVKTNRHSAFGTLSRPFNAEEMALIDSYIDRGYKLFRKRVADGRSMKVEAVEEIAQGRVWTGRDALQKHLVDEMGGMDKAVAKAAELAKLTEYHTVGYPAPPGWLDQLMDKATGGNTLDEQLREVFGECYEPLMFVKDISRTDAMQARMPYHIRIE